MRSEKNYNFTPEAPPQEDTRVSKEILKELAESTLETVEGMLAEREHIKLDASRIEKTSVHFTVRVDDSAQAREALASFEKEFTEEYGATLTLAREGDTGDSVEFVVRWKSLSLSESE